MPDHIDVVHGRLVLHVRLTPLVRAPTYPAHSDVLTPLVPLLPIIMYGDHVFANVLLSCLVHSHAPRFPRLVRASSNPTHLHDPTILITPLWRW